MKIHRVTVFYGFVTLVALAAYALGMLFFVTTIPWVDLSALESCRDAKPSILLDDEGKEWGRFQLDRRKAVPLTAMPQVLIQAFLTSEDRTFFKHRGISFRGIMRSVLVNLIRGRRVQGASTITQQLVRLLFFDPKKTFMRKIKEQFLSLSIEKQFSKEVILETYLNNIYFGCGIYGVQAASKRFWAKEVYDLTLDEAATLAAIVPAPARYCPLINPEKTRKRRDVILKLMFQMGIITQKEYLIASEKEVTVQTVDAYGHSCAPHAREHIRTLLEQQFGRSALYTQGLIIQTTLNRKMQEAATKSFKKHVKHLRTTLHEAVDGALITLAVNDSSIKAIVGGYDFSASQFNRALSAKRQIGSLFKPVIYSVGLERGVIELNDTEVDEPITIMDGNQAWSPRNYNKKFEGRMTLAHALALSKNTISVKTLLKIGIEDVIECAKKCKLAASLEPYPSLALGCIDTTVLQIASLFTAFSHQGVMVEPYLIEWIKDCWGKKIWRHKEEHASVLSWKTSSKIVQALSTAFDRFKSRYPQHWKNTKAFGKTGTTNDSRTCWFAGVTPSFTTVVYIGRDDNQSLGKDIYPSTTAFPIWLEVNKAFSHEADFLIEPSLRRVLIDPINGQYHSSTKKNEKTALKQKEPIPILLDS